MLAERAHRKLLDAAPMKWVRDNFILLLQKYRL